MLSNQIECLLLLVYTIFRLNAPFGIKYFAFYRKYDKINIMSELKGIHDGHRQRMIEKVLNNCQSMPDHELLEVLLFGAIPRKNTNETAHLLLSRFGSIQNVLEAEQLALESVEGIGRSTAGYLILIGQLIKRISEQKVKPALVKNLADVKEYLIEKFLNETEEKFYLLMLNSKYKVLSTVEFTDKMSDQVSASMSDVGKMIAIFKPAFVIIAHNHTSGVAKPSELDDIATKKVNLACLLHGASLIDHVIFANNDTYSYRNEGALEKIKNDTNVK